MTRLTRLLQHTMALRLKSSSPEFSMFQSQGAGITFNQSLLSQLVLVSCWVHSKRRQCKPVRCVGYHGGQDDGGSPELWTFGTVRNVLLSAAPLLDFPGPYTSLQSFPSSFTWSSAFRLSVSFTTITAAGTTEPAAEQFIVMIGAGASCDGSVFLSLRADSKCLICTQLSV